MRNIYVELAFFALKVLRFDIIAVAVSGFAYARQKGAMTAVFLGVVTLMLVRITIYGKVLYLMWVERERCRSAGRDKA